MSCNDIAFLTAVSMIPLTSTISLYISLALGGTIVSQLILATIMSAIMTFALMFVASLGAEVCKSLS